MASLRDIRKRIRSVKNTRQITKAMKMVSAAKLRKAQEAVVSARPYAQTIEKTVAQLMGAVEGSSNPLLEKRNSKKACEVIVITSDRGLAGGFNANVIRRAIKFVQAEGKAYERVDITTVGRKGNDFLRNRGLTIRKDVTGLLGKVTYARAQELSEEVTLRYIQGEIDAVYIVYNEFLSAISQQVVFTQLLPFTAEKSNAQESQNSKDVVADFLYEPSQQAVLNKLVPQAIHVKVLRALLESVASEHGARMSAMENATKNAGEMISSLTLFYNRTRQAAITKELMEIVSGAEALK